MMGIEIRRTGQLDNLYRDVDLVLSKLSNNEIPGSVPREMAIAAAAHSLQNMLNVDSYLDVIAIKQAAAVCGIVIPYERIEFYRTLHCIHWNKMLPEFRQGLIAMILDDFRQVFNP